MMRPVFGGPAAYAGNGGNEWKGSGGFGVDDFFNVTSVLNVFCWMTGKYAMKKLTEEANFMCSR